MRVTFPKRWISIVADYACSCGHKFRRNNRDWYTDNPFHDSKESAEKIRLEQRKRVRPCPKCKKQLKPKNKDK